MKTIAVDLDDTLNNFSVTLQTTDFLHDATCAFSREVFDGYIERIRVGAPDTSELLSTEFSSFRGRITTKCHKLALARADGVEFMQWLRDNHWRIVICTYSDLRRDGACIKKWLQDNSIPFDHLFMAWNKLEFCRAWKIDHLVDDHLWNVLHGSRYGVKVFYPMMPKHRELPAHGARGFTTFDELRPWIQN
jgi:uncharacterized HAD superfamily protein